MHPSVRDYFYAYNAPFEGEVPYLYQDVKGLVSIGVGILCNSVSACQTLPLKRFDGTPATPSEIADDFLRVVALGPNGARYGHNYARHVVKLHLDAAGMAFVVTRKLDDMVRYLRARFPEWDTYPADAQLGILSLSWGCGPAFRFPKLEAHIKAREWSEAGPESFMSTAGNPGVAPRNAAQLVCFLNAQAVADGGLDPTVLHYPAVREGRTAGWRVSS